MTVKLLVLGIDGMSWRLVKRHRRALPFFSGLQANSRYGILFSPVPEGMKMPYTGPAWSSIYTGCPPEEHGVTTQGWLLEHQNYSDLKRVTVWELVQERYPLALYGMPFTFPPFPLEGWTPGWMVSGFPCPPEVDKITWPPALAASLGPGFKPDYVCPVNRQAGSWQTRFQPERLLALERRRLETFKGLFQEHPTEVVAYGTTCLDKFGHVYPQYPSALMAKHLARWKHYQRRLRWEQRAAFRLLTAAIDRCLLRPDPRLLSGYEFADRLGAELHEFLRPERVLICSDHGFFNYGIPLKGIHDPYGYHCLSGVERPGWAQAHINDIAGMICRVLEIDPTLLGREVDRAAYHLDPEEIEALRSQLAALGYIA